MNEFKLSNYNNQSVIMWNETVKGTQIKRAAISNFRSDTLVKTTRIETNVI